MDDADRLFRPHKMDLGTAAMLAAYEAVRAMPDDTRPHTLDRVRYHAAKRAQTAERTRAAVDDGLENLAEIHQKAYERNSEALRDLVPARAWSRLGLDA